jgi:hypothetical protein
MARRFAYFTNDNETAQNSLSQSFGDFEKYFAQARITLLANQFLGARATTGQYQLQ